MSRLVALAAAIALPLCSQTVDSSRGERIFETQGCVRCHALNGKGGKSAPDLGRPLGRDYSPASFAARMWNHAPAMWSAMRAAGVQAAPLSDQQAGDLFAYFYSARYFDHPADAGRGKRAFESKGCAVCHAASGPAKPVVQWQSMANPIELAAAMWNHSANMRDAFAAKKISWPSLTGQDVADILVYARNLPAVRQKPSIFTAHTADGASLFDSKGCAGCHSGKLSLAPRLQGRTMTDVAAAMWSHAPKMGPKPPALTAVEMSSLASYLWSQQVIGAGGSAAAGRKVYDSHGCAGCHATVSARQSAFTSVSMVSSLWQHGPRMLEKMKQKDVSWPNLTESEMADLIAFLNGPRP